MRGLASVTVWTDIIYNGCAACVATLAVGPQQACLTLRSGAASGRQKGEPGAVAI